MKNELIKRILSSIFLIPVSIYFIFKGMFLFNIFLLICILITFYEWHKISKNRSYNLFGFLFLIISFYTTYKLRNDLDNDYNYLLFVVIICVSSDIGGYVFGNIFKGPKLSKISPNKTYSGIIGAYIFSIIFIIIYLINEKLNSPIEFTIEVFVFVLLISTVSQIGDITISYFKRLSKIKDTGKIIPGHGGLLDRIDGMIFAFPFSYFVFSIYVF